MKKTGYTLAEILIAIAVVGVIAGLLLPMVGKIRPDMNKMLFLQTYDSIVQVTSKLASDERYYKPDDLDWDYSKYPLLDVDNKYKFNGKDYYSKTKYCELLAIGLNAQSESCKDNPNQVTAYSSPATFITPNGAQYWVKTNIIDNTDSKSYQTDIYFDIDGAEGNNCTYEANICTQPDRYRLLVSAEGEVFPSDSMSQYYLANRVNFRLNKDKGNLNVEYEYLDDLDKVSKLKISKKSTEDDDSGLDKIPQDPDDNYICKNCINTFLKPVDTMVRACCKCCVFTTKEISKCPKCGQYLMQKDTGANYKEQEQNGDGESNSSTSDSSGSSGNDNPDRVENFKSNIEDDEELTEKIYIDEYDKNYGDELDKYQR